MILLLLILWALWIFFDPNIAQAERNRKDEAEEKIRERTKNLII